jgi:hypothetical protein
VDVVKLRNTYVRVVLAKFSKYSTSIHPKILPKEERENTRFRTFHSSVENNKKEKTDRHITDPIRSDPFIF